MIDCSSLTFVSFHAPSAPPLCSSHDMQFTVPNFITSTCPSHSLASFPSSRIQAIQSSKIFYTKQKLRMSIASSPHQASPSSTPPGSASPLAKKFWIYPESSAGFMTAVECGFKTIVINKDDLDLWESTIVKNLTLVETIELFVHDPHENTVRRFARDVKITDISSLVATYVSLDSAEQIDQLTKTAHLASLGVKEAKTLVFNKAPVVIYESTVPWKIIPAENLIAGFAKYQECSLFAVSQSIDEANLLLDALQIGVDGVVCKSSSSNIIRQFKSMMDQRNHLYKSQSLVLHPASLFSSSKEPIVSSIGMADRVCVDTCSLLAHDEGLLVGNSSSMLFLVLSEASENAYVPSRPFRVNAGPVHAYVLVSVPESGALQDGRTRYLAELKTGDKVVAVNTKGNFREVTVGRVKIERRPMVLVRAYSDGVDDNESSKNRIQGSLMVQNAETVRLACIEDVNADGKVEQSLKPIAVPVTSLEKQHRLTVKLGAKARHIGMAVDEFIVEK